MEMLNELFGGKKRKKKEREIRGYTPPRELSKLGAVMLMVMGVLMIAYFAVNISVRLIGESTVGTPYTRLENGEAVFDPGAKLSSTLFYTFTDINGVLREGHMSLLGNGEPIGETVEVYYYAFYPEYSMLANRAELTLVHMGCLVLGLMLISTGARKLREKKAEPADEASASAAPLDADIEPLDAEAVPVDAEATDADAVAEDADAAPSDATEGRE